jgi:cerevisin
VISGIHYAIKRRKKVKKRPSIILISAAGPANAGLDAALRAAVSKGMHVVVAAGNGAQDSGSTSPAREAAVISVGASNIQDKIAPFSNVGPGVTLFAPGVDIESSWIGSSALSAVLSGTSMAAYVGSFLHALYDADSRQTPRRRRPRDPHLDLR